MIVKRYLYFIAIIIFSFGSNLLAQLPNSFVMTARNAHYHGEALDLAMSKEGILFVANSRNGLCAYNYDDSNFVLAAHVDDGGEFERAYGVAVGPDGTIFVANGSDGLRAYTYDGISLTNTAHIKEGDEDAIAIDVAVSNDGTVFLISDDDGLRAYEYNGFSFSNTAFEKSNSMKNIAIGEDGKIYVTRSFNFSFLSIYNYLGDSFSKICDDEITPPNWGKASGVTIDGNGNIFVAFSRAIGIGAYQFDGSNIIEKAFHDFEYYFESSYYQSTSIDLSVKNDSTVFCPISDKGLGVYKFTGTSFENIVQVDDGEVCYNVIVGIDGSIFLANGKDGIWSYNYDGKKLNYITKIDNKYNIAERVSVINDSTVCLANGQDGLRIYHFNGSNFSTLAHFVNSGYAEDVAIGQNGIIALANGIDGLRLFTFDGTSLINVGHINDGGYAYSVVFDSYGNIYLANYTDGLRMYNFNGTQIQNIEHIEDYFAVNNVFVDLDNIIYVKGPHDGLILYKFNGTSLNIIGKIERSAAGLAVNDNGVLFIAAGGNGLDAYIRNNHSIQFIANINDGDKWDHSASDVSIGSDGTLFLANTYDGLRAYTFDGNTFVNTAYIDDWHAQDVEVSPNNTIFVASVFSGLHAYKYSGLLNVSDLKSIYSNSFILQQNHPNPFNPKTNIYYSIPFETKVVIKLFNVLGEEIETLVDKTQLAGNYNFLFNSKTLPSGIYFYQLQTNSFVDTKKMVLIR